MKTTLHAIRLSIKLPEYNLKQNDAEIYNKHKCTIIGNIIAREYEDFSPKFTSILDDEMMIEFDMHTFPEYDIVGSLFFFDIKKQDIVEEIGRYRQAIENIPKI